MKIIASYEHYSILNNFKRLLQITIASLSGLLLVAIGLHPLYISHNVSMYLEIIYVKQDALNEPLERE